MKSFIPIIIMTIIGLHTYAQHNIEHDDGLMCSHLKSSINNEMGKYLYYWQSPYLDDYDVTFYFLDLEVTNTSTAIIGDVTIEGIAVAEIDTFAF